MTWDYVALTNAFLDASDVPTIVTPSTPLPVTVAAGSVAVISSNAAIEALSATNYDLAAAAYDQTSAITGDYELDHFEAKFSTAVIRTITVISVATNTVLYAKTTQALSIEESFDKKVFKSGSQIRVTITQTTGACLVSLRLIAVIGTSLLAPSTNTVNQGNAGSAAWPVQIGTAGPNSATNPVFSSANLTGLNGAPLSLTNPLPVQECNVVQLDAGNSVTGFAVSAGTPFVGVGHDLFAEGGWLAATINIVQTVAGADGQLFFEFGPNNVSWPISVPETLTGQPFVLPLPLATVRRYFRVRVTGTVAFTIDLETLLHKTAPPDLTQVPGQLISATTPLKNQRSIIAGKYQTAPTPAAANSWPEVPTNLLGYLFTVNEPFLEDVSLGRVPGHIIARIHGKNDTLGTAFEDVWNPSSAHVYPASAGTVTLVSSSVNDTSAGTGIRQVRIVGLDASFNVLEETQNMNGTTNVVTTNTYRRIQEIKAVTVGSGENAAGNITATIGGNLQAQIDVGYNRSFGSFYTIPNGKSAVVVKSSITTGGATQGTEIILVSRDTTVANSPFLEEKEGLAFQGAWVEEAPVSVVWPGKTDIKYVARATSGTTAIRTDYALLLIDSNLVA